MLRPMLMAGLVAVAPVSIVTVSTVAAAQSGNGQNCPDGQTKKKK
jgi:hypothetical protein